MASIIRLAKSTSELNDVLQTRFHIMLEAGIELGQYSRLTRRIIDHLDVFPRTYNFIAYSSGAPVACLRAVEYQPDEPLLNIAYDFAESRNALKGRVYCLDKLVVASVVEGRGTLQRQLIKMALGLLTRRDVQHAFFLCPEEIMPIAVEVGFKSLQDPFVAQTFDMRVVPMVVDVSEFYGRLTADIADQEIMRFQEVFYYSIFTPGEIMVVQGEKGSTAYLIEEGEVEVVIRNNENLIPVSTIGKGHMIGEVAMVTNEPRTASLIAKQTTSCISFDRTEFLRLMYNQPQRSLDVFKIFSKRLTESNRRLAEARA
jgi:CRP-like cAMP-binding protein